MEEYFTFSLRFDGLILTLTDLSEDSENFTHSWKLSSAGDTPILGDTNPFTVELSPNKVYTVELLDSSGVTLKELKLHSTDTALFIYQSISQVAKILLPGYSFDWDTFDSLKVKWQGVVGPAAEVPSESTYDETKYPQPANSLIAYLIVRDLVIYQYNALLMGTGEGSGSPTKIVTGPTEVDFSGVDKTLSSLMQGGRPFSVFMEQLCSLARYYGLHFVGCKNHITSVRVFYLSDYSYEYRYVKAPQYEPKNN